MLKFGNSKKDSNDPLQPVRHDLNAGFSGGLNDLRNGVKDSQNLQKDLGNMAHSKDPIKQAGKIGKDAKNLSKDLKGLDGLNDFAGDLKKNLDPDTDVADGSAGLQSEKPNDEKQNSLADGLGSLGSLGESVGKMDKKTPSKADQKKLDSLKNFAGAVENPKKALNHPEKLMKDAKNLTGKDPLSDGLGSLATPLSKNLKNPHADKLASGTIKPQDLMRGSNRNDNQRLSTPQGFMNKLKDGLHKAGQKVMSGAKSAVSGTAGAITGGIKAVTGKTIATAVATKAAVATLAAPVLIGTGGVGALIYNYNDYQVLDDPNICAVANDNGTGFADTVDTSGGATSTAGFDEHNVKKVWNFLKKKGFSGIALGGIMGNLAQESGFNPNATSGNNDLGLIQWTDNASSNALTKLKQWCSSHGKKPNDLDAQLEYLWTASGSANTPNGVGNNATLIKGLESASTIEQAADLWEQQVEGAGLPRMAQRYAYGHQLYEQLGGKSVKGDKSKLDSLIGKNASMVADLNSAIAETINKAVCQGQTSTDNTNTTDMLKIAEKLDNYFTYNQVRPVDSHVTKNHGEIKKGDVDNIDKGGQTDCSGYVYTVMKLSGKKVPNGGWTTGYMESDARGAHQYLKQVDPKDAKPGDILIYNTSGTGDGGHTAILMTTWKGANDDTKVIHCSTYPKSGVSSNVGVRSGFLSLLGGSMTIARPVD